MCGQDKAHPVSCQLAAEKEITQYTFTFKQPKPGLHSNPGWLTSSLCAR